MTNDSEAAFYVRDVEFLKHSRALPDNMQAECRFFFWASEYNRAHEVQARSNARDRRLARDFFQIEKDFSNWPQPLARHCERILATDRDKRVTRIRERQNAGSEFVLRLKRNSQGGDVIPFPAQRRAAAQQTADQNTASA